MFARNLVIVLFTLTGLANLTGAQSVSSAANPPVLTAQRVFQEVISESPFIVDRTTTVTWTQSPSISDTSTAPTSTPTISIKVIS